MRIVGNMMGDFFMGSLSRDEKGAQRLYPFPPEIDPSGILEWEVQEEENPTVAMKKSIVHARKRRKTQNQ